jgi:dethiobiotin synthetase
LPGSESMIESLLITGTDTGVGKTFVTGGIAAELVRRGVDAGVMKPLATGGRPFGGRLASTDARFLRRASGVKDALEEINPVCLKPPLAPSVAAALSGRRIDLGKVWSAFGILRARHSVVLVEGVGGLLVPLTRGFTVAHLARRLKLPILVVARPTLGTLNHTALTVHAARTFGLPVLGLVLNWTRPVRRGLAERHNPAALEAQTGVPILGEIPFLKDRSGRGLHHPAFRKIVDALV